VVSGKSWWGGGRRRLWFLAVAALVVLSVLQGGVGPAPAGASPTSSSVRTAEPVERPNIIFFLTDDMSSQHLPYMPNTRRLIFRQGASFESFHANIALCCPSRASILTGKYGHNTGILGNSYPGGFYGFHERDEATDTYALALRQAGYHTSLMGKYLNGYPYMRSVPEPVDPTYVPPGWSDWAVPTRGAFFGRNYDLNLNGRIVHKEGPGNYLGDYLNDRTLRKIRRNRDGEGLAMFLSFFGPHNPMPASPVEKGNARLARRLSTVRVPRTPDFNERDVRDKPAFIRRMPRLDRRERAALDAAFRRQVLSVKSIDRYVGEVVRELRATGQLANTYLVFTSDNGYHMGSHRLRRGKNSAYETDVRLPLAIRGPGVEPGTQVGEVTGNIDLAPTFADMAGIDLPYEHDGESLLPLAQGLTPHWRSYFLVQRGHTSTYATSARGLLEPAPEAEQETEESIPRYRSVISEGYTYVLHKSGEEELYDAREDPYQVDNLLAGASEQRDPELHGLHQRMQRALEDVTGCVGVEACRVG